MRIGIRQMCLIFMGATVCSLPVRAAETPNLTPMEQLYRSKGTAEGVADRLLQSDLAPRRYVDPRIKVTEMPLATELSGGTTNEFRHQLLGAGPAARQTNALVNGGFENGTLSGWTTVGNLGVGTPSGCGAPRQAEAVVVGPGLQPLANNDTRINRVDFGGFACRLGDEIAWGLDPANQSKCNRVYQDQVVPATTTNFVFAYAVLAENPGHGVGEDPYFEVMVEDRTTSTILYDMKDYTTSFDAGNPCAPWCPGVNSGIVYRPWVQVSITLSPAFAGHNVRLSLLASDCSPSAHFCEGFLDVAAVVCPDAIAPGSAALAASCPADSMGTIVQWAAPSDQIQSLDALAQNCIAGVGPAAFYDLRWSSSPIVTVANFNAANQVSAEPVPAAAGTPESFTIPVAGHIWIALRSLDQNFNASAITSVESTCPGPTLICSDGTPPASAPLAATCISDTLGTSIQWTAPIDPTQVPDGLNQNCVAGVRRAASYDIRWSEFPIASIAEFNAATQVVGEPIPATPGTPETFTVAVPGKIWIALRTLDQSSNASAVTSIQSPCPTIGWTLITSAIGPGSVARSPSHASYLNGTTVTLTAVPSTLSQSFIEWSGDATGEVNPLPVTMTSNMSIVARFHTEDPGGNGGGGGTRLHVTLDPAPLRSGGARGGAMVEVHMGDRAGRAEVLVFDIRGRVVRRLIDRELAALATEKVRWDGTDRNGRRPTAGVYFVRFVAPGIRESTKVPYIQ